MKDDSKCNGCIHRMKCMTGPDQYVCVKDDVSGNSTSSSSSMIGYSSSWASIDQAVKPKTSVTYEPINLIND